MILSAGQEAAQLVLLLDYPTKEEIAHSKVCFGSQFSFYDRVFRALNYSAAQTYRISFFKEVLPVEWRKLLNRNKLRYPYVKENEFNLLCENYAEDTVREIVSLKEVKFIIMAGEIPLNIFTGEKKIGKFQGSILPFSGKWLARYPELKRLHIIPILPFRVVYSNILMEPILRIHLGKAIQYLTEQYVPFEKKYNIWVCNTVESFRTFINRHRSATYWTSDFETIYSYPTCISFCGDGRESISVPLLGARGISIEEKYKLWKAIVEFFQWLKRNNIPLINQNFNYDWTVADKVAIPYGDCYGGDTMIYAHVLYPEFPRDLGFLTSIYTDIPYFKDEGKEFDPSKHDFSRLYKYNATDALATHIIYSEQRNDGNDLGVSDFYENFEAPLLQIYHRMEGNGIRIDDTERKRLIDYNTNLLEEKIQYVTSFYDEGEINFKSPQQVAHFLYEYLACPPRYKYTFDEETGERSKSLATGADEIEEIAVRETNSIFINILYGVIAIRKLYKILEFLSTPEHPDGKMRTGYKLTGTKSGRTSGSKTIDFQLQWNAKEKRYKKVALGYSFQTIPKHAERLPDGTIIGGNIRNIFIPDHDHVFIEGDKSQAEARVVTVLAGDFHLLPLFDDKVVGIHRTTAGWIYNVPPETVSKSTEQYNIGKRARHAGNYGMEPLRLAVMAHIKYNMAEYILNRFHGAQPNIKQVFHKCIIQVLHTRSGAVLVTPQGRRREFFGRKDDTLYKEGYSYYPQAVVSDDVKGGMMRLSAGTENWVSLINEAHDSVLAMVHKDNKERYVELWDKSMHNPIDFRKGTLQRDIELVIPTELSWSENSWADMKEIK